MTSRTLRSWEEIAEGLSSKYTWLAKRLSLKLPEAKEVLILDAVNSDIAEALIESRSTEILHTRMERLNIYALIMSVLEKNFWAGKRFCAYQDAYIRLSQPKLVVTAVDNNLYFYSISKRFSSVKTAFIQCARRSAHGDVFNYISSSERGSVDLMLVYSKSIGRLYQNYISGRIETIGAVKNNAVARKDMAINRKNNHAVFISQWRPTPEPERFRKYDTARYVSQKDFHYPEEVLMRDLRDWLRNRGLRLTIYSASKAGEKRLQAEREYYQRIIGDSDFNFYTACSHKEGLLFLDRSAITIGCESTLVYESISRGNRGAAFHCRGELLGWHDFDFGWPMTLESVGFFWTNHCNVGLFCKIVEDVLNCSDTAWKDWVDFVRDNVLYFDPGNNKGKQAIGRLIDGKI